MSSRFPSKESVPSEGSRGPSAKRLSVSLALLQQRNSPTVVRNSSFAFSKKRHTVDNATAEYPDYPSRPASPARIPRYENERKEKVASPSSMTRLCQICLSESMPSGKGLMVCPKCHGVQLKSGLMSHAFSVKNSEQELASIGRKGNTYNVCVTDLGNDGKTNPVAVRQAWRRLSEHAHIECCREGSVSSRTSTRAPDDDSQPIMAGFVNTGYYPGDRVKCSVRVAGSHPERTGWNPLQAAPEEGVVTGPGLTAGEIMVKFDSRGDECSLKMHQIERVREKDPVSNIERSSIRRTSRNRSLSVSMA